MFLILESKVGESILAIFFVVFSLKKGQEMDGRHANYRDRTKEQKMHALLNETGRGKQEVFLRRW